MTTTYKIEGEINRNIISELCLKFGRLVEWRIVSGENLITVADARSSVEIIFANYGLRILEIISDTEK